MDPPALGKQTKSVVQLDTTYLLMRPRYEGVTNPITGNLTLPTPGTAPPAGTVPPTGNPPATDPRR